MKSEYDFIIGIDPDIDLCGIAILAVGSKTIQLRSVTPVEAIDTVWAMYNQFHIKEDFSVAVVVELDRQNRFNWHLSHKDTKETAKRKGFDQGRCFQTAVMLADHISSLGVPVIEKAPLVKCWSGRDRKITHEEVERLKGIHIITKHGNTNQEQRDALLLALDISNIPLVLLPQQKR